MDSQKQPLAMSDLEATGAAPKNGGGNVVAIGLLQIQHRIRNALLISVWRPLSLVAHRFEPGNIGAQERLVKPTPFLSTARS